jgi:ABC-2 type transport system ATP-binding protein
VVDRFSDYKIVTLDFADELMPGDLGQFGEVLEIVPPRARLEVDRNQIAAVLSTVLANYAIQDVTVEDPPLEDVIASLFTLTEKQAAPGAAAHDGASANGAAKAAASVIDAAKK